MEYYAAEIELNAKFHTFAKNCSIVYCGHNTVAAQLKYKSKNGEQFSESQDNIKRIREHGWHNPTSVILFVMCFLGLLTKNKE